MPLCDRRSLGGEATRRFIVIADVVMTAQREFCSIDLKLLCWLVVWRKSQPLVSFPILGIADSDNHA